MTLLKFAGPVDSGSAQWSPKMTLLLTTHGEGKSVALHRPREAHTVWELKEMPDNARCCGVVWTNDGKRVALLTTMSQCLIHDVNSGKLLVDFKVKDVDPSLGKWHSFNDSKCHKFVDLKNDDILKALPKLLPLPASFNGVSKFSSRQHIDSLIQNGHGSDDGIDLLLLFGGNYINVTINSLFNIGGVEICGEDDEIIDYLSHDGKSYILTTSLMTMKHSLKSFQLNFDNPYLNKLGASISKTIGLLGYIDEVLNFLSQETRNYLDFNNKFLGILRDEIDKRNETISDELYNLLLTGMMNDDVKDWLENTIGDRGVKKWEKLGEVTFENVRRTIIYHLVPSCERLIILLCDLKSIFEILLMKEEEENKIIPLINEMLKSVKEYLSSIFQYIVKINREHELFNSFITWINFILVELQEEDPSKYQYKTPEVSQFIINNHLERSILFMLIPNFRRSFNKVKINSSDLFDILKVYFKQKIIKTDVDIELGDVSSHCILVQHKELFIIAKNGSRLEVSIVNTGSLSKNTIHVQFEKEIKDFKANNEKIMILTNNQLKEIQLSQLIKPETFNGEELSTTLTSFSESSEPTELSINFSKSIACIISSGFQRYQIYDI